MKKEFPNLKVQQKIDDIAIIGIDIKFPEADNLDMFWKNLTESKESIREIPSERKKDLYNYRNFSGLSTQEKDIPKLGYLESIDKFDYNFFNISPKEASLMDPNQRLFLEVAWKTIEDAGYGGECLKSRNVGVYLGYKSACSNIYQNMIEKIDPQLMEVGAIGNKPTVIASRLSYLLDLKGPNMLVDTACSSALVCIHLACQAIRNLECEMALVGSIKLDILPQVSQVKMGIESPDGRVRAFDDEANGTGGGEGVAAILLKPLSKAMEDKDHIYAVIKGSAVNQDGHSMGIAAPNAIAQEAVLVNAWKSAGINPETIGYIEAHGTGTRLGDSIEIEGINRAFKRVTTKKNFCAISAVKTNIGHLDNAAGMAGIVKAVLALQHKQIPPVVNFKSINKNINMDNSAIYINDRLREWKNYNNPRRCGVSSFGLSGTNSHVVLEEAPELEKIADKVNSPQVFTLSANSKFSLEQLVQSHIKFLNQNQNVDLQSICQISNIGRGHYSYRLAIITHDILDLKNKLLKLDLSNNEFIKDETIFSGKHYVVPFDKEKEAWEITEDTKREYNNEALSKMKNYIENDKLQIDILKEICKLYIKGAEIQWNLLYSEAFGKISMPTYTFEPMRCWLNIPTTCKNGYLTKVSLKSKTESKSGAVLVGRKSSDYTEDEKWIAEVWAEVLGLKEINIYEDIYDLGGDSLIANHLVNRMISQSGLAALSVSDVLEYGNIYELAKYIQDELRQEQRNEEINELYKTLVPVKGESEYILSYPQQRMFVVNYFKNMGSVYNMNRIFRVEGELDVVRVNKAFTKIIERHASLRTSFGLNSDGQPIQYIHQKVDFKVDFFEAEEKEISHLVSEYIRPFDLKKVPLIRVGLIRISKEQHILIIDMHHIIADGTSTGIVMKEFRELYEGRTLPDLQLEYTDYAVWQKAISDTPIMTRQREFWLDIFRGHIPVLNLPTDYPRPVVQSFTGAKVNANIEEELTQRVRAFCLKHDVTLHMVLLSAYYILLSKYANQEDIVIGIATSGRTSTKIEDIVGMFVNTLAMRNYPKGEKTYLEFLSEVKNNSLLAYQNQDYQLDELVSRLYTQRDRSRNPLFDVVFTITKHQEVEIEGLKFTVLDLDEIKARFDLIFSMCEYKDHIEYSLVYSSALFKKETIEKMACYFRDLVGIVIQNPYINIEDISLISSGNQQVIHNKLDKKDVEFDF